MNNTKIIDYMVNSNKTTWRPLVEAGADTIGISVKKIQFDEEQPRPPE